MIFPLLCKKYPLKRIVLSTGDVLTKTSSQSFSQNLTALTHSALINTASTGSALPCYQRKGVLLLGSVWGIQKQSSNSVTAMFLCAASVVAKNLINCPFTFTHTSLFLFFCTVIMSNNVVTNNI